MDAMSTAYSIETKIEPEGSDQIGMQSMVSGLERVRTYVIDADSEKRNTLINNLEQSGFTDVVGAETMAPLRDAAEAGAVDLIIIETAPGAKDAAPFLKSVRHHEIGANPFLIAIATTATADSEHIGDLIDSGFDDIVRRPHSFETLLKRILAFVETRKKFVVTTDYIGPDRRTDGRKQEGLEIPLMDVPNPVHLLAKRRYSHADIQSLATETNGLLNGQKIKRHVAQVQWLIDHILPCFLYESVDDDCQDNLYRLVDVSVDLTRRIVGTDYEHTEDVIVDLVNVARRIANDPYDANTADVSQLPSLANAIEQGFRNRRPRRF